ncbi:retrovirus-related pol polyprotein from transposon TNT 1-94 [Tanacetum coccineum]
MKVKKSLHVTLDESPPPPKTSPLVDDDLVKEEAIEVSEKKPLGNDIKYETLEIDEIVNIKESKRTAFGLHPYQFTYPERRLTMEEMLYKFINEGRREHEEMSAFIREFRTTNELLFKERNNSLSELRFELYGLSKVINNALISECEGKGVTTRGGKITTQEILNDNTKIRDKEPSVFVHDKLDAPKEVLVENEPQKAKEQVVQPSIKVQTSLIPFPRRLRKEKKEAQQRKFLENLKQLYINLLFIEALAQMPKYAKFMKCLLTNKARLQEACTVMMNERSMEPKPTRMSLELADRARDDEVIFNVDQSIKRPAAEDDECYGIDDLDETINVETQELFGGVTSETGGLYLFDVNKNGKFNSGVCNFLFVCHVSSELWHCRLGHPADQVLSILEGDTSNVEGNRRVASDDCNITVEDEAATIATQIGDNVTFEGNVHNSQNGEDFTSVLETSPVLRRSSRQRNLPSKLNDFVVGNIVRYGIEKYVCYSKLADINICFSTTLNKSFEPKYYLEASQNPKWVEAMNLEMEAFHRNNTSVLVDL